MLLKAYLLTFKNIFISIKKERKIEIENVEKKPTS
jgi:hypothetical protein